MRRYGYAPVFLCSGLLLATASLPPAGASDEFARFAEILRERCIACHNPDDAKGDLSLADASFLGRDDLIDRSDIDSSLLLQMIVPQDGEAEMPKDAAPLSAAQIQVVRDWIQAGAKWPTGAILEPPELADLDWWSLRPLSRPALPRNDTGTLWCRTPIDRFILRKLREFNLQPSATADRRTLIRRLYFDLLGLPPSPVQVNAFVRDTHPLAYERLVDALLASPRYGERWARHWLDIVHFGETHGYDKDKPRDNAWPYRDYVIRSLNADKPYSRFIQEQLAGDVLWPHNPDALEATGFISAGPWDFIGHAEVPETKLDGKVARHLDRDDMVTSTLNSFLSLTVQCARCHDHKFDPVSQEHYYSLQAIFAALDRADRKYDRDPEVARQRARLTSQIAVLQSERNALHEQRIRAWKEKELRELLDQMKTKPPTSYGFHSQISKTQDSAKWVQIDLGTPQSIEQILLFPCYDGYNGIGAGFGFPVRYHVDACNDAGFQRDVTRVADLTVSDVENPGLFPRVHPTEVKARYVRITATKLAPRSNDFIFALSEVAVLGPQAKNLARGVRVTALDSVSSNARWRNANLTDGLAYDRRLQEDRLLEVAERSLTHDRLRREFAQTVLGKQVAARDAAIAELRQQLADLSPQSLVYSGMIHTGSGAFRGTGHDGGRPRTIHVLLRGEISNPKQEVAPGTVPIIQGRDWQFQLAPDHAEGERRVALANWIIDRQNPLTWRSAANRIWHYHFGRGLVGTPNDFGRMGSPPSHPELLDWLACELRDKGQSWKHLHRLILCSSVYRQHSAHDPTKAQRDADNRYFWRMPRRALDAESIRDAALLVSGSLQHSMHGASFRDFVIDKPEHSPHYEYHLYDPNQRDTHRRSIYRFLVRSQPQPFMDTLDCADPSSSVPARQTTITPLQALALLNNKFMLCMAESFARDLDHLKTSPEERVREAFLRTIGREPDAEELLQLVEYSQAHGLQNTCRAILNLNEFVFVD